MNARGATAPRRPQEVAQWLRERPTLAAVRAAYPADWEQVSRDLAALAETRDPAVLRERLARAAAPAPATPGHAPPAETVRTRLVQQYLTVEALRQAALQAETGCRTGRLRFGLVNGFVLQRLLFEHGLRRKPVALTPFRLAWPLLTQRRYLMPLVMPQGIYCFYSRPLIRALARLIGDRPTLEIAAGDGTLARFLRGRGVRITATDDHSWHDSIDYTATADQPVERLDAARALRTHRPEVVLCSWPPAGNSFERHVFTTDSVQLYIVISTDLEYAAGDWDAYRAQTGFERTRDERLSRLVLPPGTKAAVHVFRRVNGPGRPGR